MASKRERGEVEDGRIYEWSEVDIVEGETESGAERRVSRLGEKTEVVRIPDARMKRPGLPS